MLIVGFHVDGGLRFRSEALDEDARTRALRGVLAALEKQPDVAIFPAGYFCVRRRAEVDRLAGDVHAEIVAADRPTWVIFGVDVMPRTGKNADEELYSYIFASHRAKAPVKFQQASKSSDGLPAAPGVAPFDVAARTLNVGTKRVTVCVCGEAWSATVRAALASARTNAILEPAHQAIKTGAGPRSWEPRLVEIASGADAPVIVAEHTRTTGKPHVFTMAGGRTGSVGAWTEPDRAGVWMFPVTWTVA